MSITTDTPITTDSLREHFSRRASAARIAWRKAQRPSPLQPSPADAPAAAAVDPYLGEVSHR